MTTEREMPKYRSHKEVWALKIKRIDHHPNSDPSGKSCAGSYGALITPVEDGYAPFDVSAEYMMKHNPKEGGYFVVYADGYKSWSPVEAFESGYTRI